MPLRIALLELQIDALRVKAALEGADHNVTVIDNFSIAKPLLQSAAFDVIIADVRLENGGSVFDFLRWIKSDPILKIIPVVLLSLRAGKLAKHLRDGLQIASRELGAAKYIVSEPLEPDYLNEQISDLQVRAGTESNQCVFCKAMVHSRTQLATQQLELLNQRDHFIAMLAHDLHSPLAGSNRAIEMMMEGATGSLSKSQLDILTTLSNSNKSLLRLITNVLESYKMETCGEPLELLQLDLSTTVIDCVRIMEPMAFGKNIRIVNLCSKEELVTANTLAIRRVISNVLSNAIKFTSTGGSIEIKIVKKGNKKVLTIKDNGIGIDKEQQPHVFEKFFQADTKSRAAGLGLGLHLCKDLMSAQHGSITCASDLNVGYIFEIVLPIAHKCGTALIVEQDVLEQNTLKGHLQELSVQSVCVSSGIEAMVAIEAQDYAAIFMNLDMPGLNGFRTIKALRAAGLQSPILAYVEDKGKDLTAFSDAGMNGILEKPTNLEQVRLAVDQWIRPDKPLYLPDPSAVTNNVSLKRQPSADCLRDKEDDDQVFS
jgi:two-component system sensor histidine kinase/response regulator